MNLALVLRLLGRELRGAGARLLPFVASLAVGVAAVVLVAGLADSVSRAIRMEARPLLGGDVAARSYQPIPASFAPVEARFPDVSRVDTVDFITMVATPPREGGMPGRSLVTELKAVSPGWPFYGVPALEPDRPLADLLGTDGVVVEPSLLERLGVAVGDPLRVGAATFTIRGVVTAEPGRMPTGLVAGPRVFVSLDGLAATRLDGASARTTYRAIYRAPDEATAGTLLEALRTEAAGSAWTRFETWSDAQPAAQRTIDRTRTWLGLVALLSLVVGGVGVAQSTRAHLARRLDALAVQRCLGMTPREIQGVYLAETALLALAGSVVGGLFGVGVLALAPRVLDGLLPAGAVNLWQPVALLRGVGMGLGIALLFAARPLVQASRVPPLRVLRRDVEALPERWRDLALGGLVLLAGLFGLAWAQSGDVIVAAAFVGVLAAVAGFGAGGATLLTRWLGLLAHRVRAWWLRHGLAAMGRPGAGTVPAVVSLALGVVVVLTTVLVEGRLQAQIRQEFPDTAPSAFLLDVQPDQRAGVEAMLAEGGATRVRGAPVVTARLAAVDGVGVEDLVRARSEDDKWALTREQRLSYRPELPPDNVLVAGAPFSPGLEPGPTPGDAAIGEVSLEQRYAETLGATVGSRLTFDVQGVPVELRVSSLRTVEWQSFDINFFLVVEPGVIDDAPQTVLMTAQLPADREPGVQDRLAAAFPNVTLVSVRAALAQAQGMLSRVGLGIRVVGGFTALAGIAILASAVAADASRRGREVALLKTLGTTRAGVVGMLAVEYTLVGLAAGALGAAGAWTVSRLLVERLLRLEWHTDVEALTVGILGAAVACAVAGVAANLRALRVRPAAVLRGD